MKLIKKVIEKTRQGLVVLQPEDSEDMWNLYNIIRKNDHIKAITERRLQSESSTGSVDSKRIKINLNISVESMFFDTQVCTLRINGRVIQENKYVKMFAFHTIDLELHRNVTIAKEEWDFLDLERIEDACDVTKKADVAAVIMQDGLANICLLTESLTIVRQKIEVNIPKKRIGSSATDKALSRFYDLTSQALTKSIDCTVVKAIIIASPGFIKDNFYEYLMKVSKDSSSNDGKFILQNKDKFVLVHVSSGHKSALDEALNDLGVQKKLSTTKYAQESKALDEFFSMLHNDPSRAFYGKDHVSKAHEFGAISILLLTDKLFRSEDIQERKNYLSLTEQVRSTGGKVFIFSTLHPSGEKLNQFTGVAAILKFPYPELDDLEIPSSDENHKGLD